VTIANLPLRRRGFDWVFIVFFCWAFVSCIISDAIPTLGIVQSADSTNILAQWNYAYASVNDPLFLNPPIWMRFVTGLSAFVFAPLVKERVENSWVTATPDWMPIKRPILAR
jgi:hypothetical protein